MELTSSKYVVRQHDKHFEIFEKSTEQIINRLPDKPQARKYFRFVNSGGGFAGHTPTFVARSVK